MEAFRVLVLLMAFFSCTHCDIKLTQPGSLIVKAGESLTISCKVSGYSLTDSGYYSGWIRQPAGKGLEWIGVMRTDGTSNYKESLKSKFTVSRDTSSNTVSLNGQSLQTEDTAVYYCARLWGGYIAFDYWGKGTKVTVDNAPAVGLSFLYPLMQCGSSDSSGQISLGCIAGGFSPVDFVSFSWKSNKSQSLSDFHQYSTVKSNDVNTVVSQIRVNAADKGGATHYECVARHQSLNTEMSRTIQKRAPSTSPTVSLVTLPSDGSRVDSLMCVIQGFSPKDITVAWKAGATSITGHTWKAEALESGLYSTSSLLKVDSSIWEADTVYHCEVKHGSDTITKTISKALSVRPISRPSLDVTLKPPEIRAMFINNQAVLKCIVTGQEEAVKGTTVTWMLDNTAVKESSKIKTVDGKDGHLFKRNSTLTLPAQDWEDGKTVTCKVQQKDGLSITKSLKFGQTAQGSPTVSIRTPSTEELKGRNEFFLVCMVTDVSPGEIYIMWERKKDQFEEGITGEPLKTGDKYSVTSLFTVSKTDWEKGIEYTCNARFASHKRGNISAKKTVSKLTGNSMECPVCQ